ncbi:MAG: alpha/beta hydrolase, partial [Actinobacteria bacterium]|nr:alpha/beta hydrolase [Actinomycetota bacterium]
ARFSSAGWVGEVDVPTAVVVTMRDVLVPPERQLALARAIPGTTVHPVDGDHGAFLDPDGFPPVLVGACRAVTP